MLAHQVHPATITADLTVSALSSTLLCRDGPRPRSRSASCCPPPARSPCSPQPTDLDAPARTAPRRYLLAHMPPPALAVRLADYAPTGHRARRRNQALPLGGPAVITAGWSIRPKPRTSTRA